MIGRDALRLSAPIPNFQRDSLPPSSPTIFARPCVGASSTMSTARTSSALRLVPRRTSPSCRHLATHVPLPEKDCSTITPPYARLLENLQRVRSILRNKPLTLAEKILYSHIHEPERTLAGKTSIRGEYLQLKPQRVAMQDASAQCVLFTFKRRVSFLTNLFVEWHCEPLRKII